MTGSLSRPSTGRMVRFAGLTSAAALLLSACGSVHPGDAAVVGSDSISQTRVDGVATAVCTVNTSSGQSSSVPSRNARRFALNLLLDSTLSLQFGRKEGVRPDQHLVSTGLAQSAQTFSSLPPAQRADLQSAVHDVYAGQSVLESIGRRSLEKNGQTNVTTKQALAQGSLLRNQYAQSLDIEVDPRFGTYEKGQVAPTSGSLSSAVSPTALDGQTSDPSTDWVSALPASQKCS